MSICQMKKANTRGTGFFTLSQRLSSKFQEGNQVLVKIQSDVGIHYYGTIKRFNGKLVVYVPKEIMTKHELCHKTLEIRLEKVDGFHTKVGKDGRIYLPKKRAEELNLDEGQIIEVNGQIGDRTETAYGPVLMRKRGNKTTYRVNFNKNYAGKEGVFKIKNTFRPSSEKDKVSKDLNRILEGLDWIVTGETVRVFDGNKLPVKMSRKVRLSEICYYLGAFFADGTKRGNSWGIGASTFQQGKFYKSVHDDLFKSVDLHVELNYTFHPATRLNRDYLIEMWEDKVGVKINSVQEYKTETKKAKNRNKFGTLYFREHKILMKEIYNRTLSNLFEKILKEKNEALAWDFILGVLEGDGYPGGKKRGHIKITTNKQETSKLRKVFKILNLKHEGAGNKSGHIMRIGSLEIMTSLDLIGDKLFQFYPKRRMRFIRRLLNTGTARFLLGEKMSTSGWIKNYLLDRNVLDENYEITPKGRVIRKELKKLSQEISFSSIFCQKKQSRADEKID